MNKAINKAVLAACGVVLMASAWACNSKDDTQYDDSSTGYSSVAVKAFSLKEDKTVLNKLDSVFFSIDLNNMRIFNADSLPVGTDVSALAVELSTTQCSECKFHFTSKNGTDTVVDYLTNPDDKINFTKPVSLTLKSASGSIEATYNVKVNVHTVVADSLYWSRDERQPLPAECTSQRTVKMGDQAWSLCLHNNSWELYRSTDVFAGEWAQVATDIPQNIDATTLIASDDTLYILTADGSLLSSTDGKSWAAAGPTGWTAITAIYNGGVLGIKNENGVLRHVAFPAGAESDVASDFPVKGTSAPMTLTSKWTTESQVLVAGGRTAAGTLTGVTWAYDGSRWARVGEGLPAAEGYAVARYTLVETDTMSWQSSRIPALVAMGGRNALGECQREVYVSRDMGMTWSKGAQLLQLPAWLPATTGSDLLVFEYNRTLSPLAVKPITEWQVPVLFRFGGYDNAGVLQPYYWQGAISSLAFKPLQ